MVSKTREKLIDVARQLFMNKGVENTTMNDIATASEKGRRTIYTYFKNKKEIYNAVVEQQSELLVKELREIATTCESCTERLSRYLSLRLNFSAEIQQRKDGYRYFFLREHRKIERIHRMAISKELDILRGLLNEGIESGEFNATQAMRLPSLVALLTQGGEYVAAHNGFELFGVKPNNIQQRVVNFLLDAILIKH